MVVIRMILNPDSAIFRITALCFILLAGYVIYSPGLTGGYIYDDYSNIRENPDLEFREFNLQSLIKAANSGFSGQTGRPVSMLTFALNVYFSGYDPYVMKLTNILIHLLNGILIYVFTTQLLIALKAASPNHDLQNNSSLFALAITSIWLFHPVNLIGVLYIVQRMNLLSSFFTLLGLVAYMAGRQKTIKGNGGIACLLFSIIICGSLATLSKENGLLMYLYLLLIEFVCFQFGARERHIQSGIKGFFFLAAFIAACGLIYLIMINPEFLFGGYQGRGFDMYERILTESRVLWFYLYLIVLPNPGDMSLHHDDVVISKSLIDPLITLPALLGMAALIGTAIMLRKRMPVISFGLLFFFAGQSMESTIIPLELVFEYRNYLPSYGIIFIIIYLLFTRQTSPNLQSFFKITVVFLICLFAFNTHLRATQWGNPLMLRFHELDHNPESARTIYEIGRFYASALDAGVAVDREAMYAKAEYYFGRVLELQPGNIQALAGLVILNSSNDKPLELARLDSLIENLGRQPLNYTEIATFNAVLNCEASQDCDIQDDYINKMIKSVVENTHLHTQAAAVLYYNLSLYYIKYFGDFSLARKYAERAITEKPDDRSARLLLEYIISNQNGKHNQDK